MPFKPKVPCRHPGCPELVEPGRLCKTHWDLTPLRARSPDYSPCFVYKFFRNVYFFFMGSDPNAFTRKSVL